MSSPGTTPSYVQTPAAGFLTSLAVDRPLARCDVAGSIAHAEMLRDVGLLTSGEAATITGGLRTVAREIDGGTFPWREDLEDVHTNVEVRLTELIGPLGGKVHTGRSRNDQIALDERLLVRSLVREVGRRLVDLAEALIVRADEERATAMPGYTHLQRAQPVTMGHLLLAHFWRLDRDLDRLLATEARSDVSPLGAGALAGSTLPIDPAATAKRLGFSRPFENSLDAVSDRDPLVELLFDLALLGVHASGFAEEVAVFASKEFGFVERTAALGSGSSLMPQKRNPDVAELVRGKAGRSVGDLVALLLTLKGLPLAYNRDLQEDKGPVLDAAARTIAVLEALTALVRSVRFDHARLAEAAADPELLATDVAERLVAGGMPFREAHEAVGRAYREAPVPLSAATLRGRLPREAGTEPFLDPTGALARRRSAGGPGPEPFARQFAEARRRLDARRTSLSSLDRKVGLVEELVNPEER
jgi:argininosuccinate lyase